jgi:type VI secretion system protein ImpB
VAKKESVQKRLQKVRPPRVQLTYDVEIGDAIEVKEIPFVVGVLGDFAAQSREEQGKVRDRKFVNIDMDNFDDVMDGMAPRAAFRVKNRLTPQGGELGVDLEFRQFEDFRPESVVQQVEPLRKLQEARAKPRRNELRKRIFSLTVSSPRVRKYSSYMRTSWKNS